MIIEEMLSSIQPNSRLEESSHPWVETLVEAVNKAIIEHECDYACLDMESTGLQLREAMRTIPAAVQIAILNDSIVSFGKRRRRQQDKDKNESTQIKMLETKLKMRLITAGAMVFIGLSVLVTAVIAFVAVKTNTAPDASVATGIFGTFTEIIKLIYSK